jgi:peptidase E
MSDKINFFPTAGDLLADDKIYITENLHALPNNGIQLGDIAIIHTVVKTGDAVILSMEVDSKFVAVTVKADTVVELVPPF